MRCPAVAIAAVLIITTCLFSGPDAGGQAASPGSVSTGPKLQAELLKTIDASHARAGDAVTARTVTPLEFDGAKVPPGAVVKGHIAEAQPNRLVLVFDGIDVEKNTPLSVGLSLRAVMMPRAVMASQPHGSNTQLSPRAEAGGGSTGAVPGTPTGRGDMLRSP